VTAGIQPGTGARRKLDGNGCGDPFAVLAKGGHSQMRTAPLSQLIFSARYCAIIVQSKMPKGLRRYYGQDHLHYLTCSCYHRQPWLAMAQRRDLFLQILEEVRQRYRFVVVGYVVMPEHIHLLISEPERGTPSTVMQVVKQRFARRVLRKKKRSAGQGEFWPQQEQMRAP
jgi:REP element-mobilizing transposase RayT